METTMPAAPKTNRIAFEVFLILVILAPLAYALAIWDRLPENIPTHWNFKGEVDGWTPKPWGGILMPMINAGLYLFFLALPYIDPRKAHYIKFQQGFLIIRVLMHLFMSFIGILTLMYAAGHDIKMDMVIRFSVILIFLMLGNYFTTLKSNFFVGIRTPWTLSSENVWKLTHRFAGRLWVFTSLAMLIANIIFPLPPVVFVVWVIVIATLPIVYSFILYRKEQKEKNR